MLEIDGGSRSINYKGKLTFEGFRFSAFSVGGLQALL